MAILVASQYIGGRPAGRQQQPDRHGSEQSEEGSRRSGVWPARSPLTVGATRLIAKAMRRISLITGVMNMLDPEQLRTFLAVERAVVSPRPGGCSALRQSTVSGHIARLLEQAVGRRLCSAGHPQSWPSPPMVPPWWASPPVSWTPRRRPTIIFSESA